ncbi:MAG: carbonic anhydrase [Acidimicrobiia bacterium]|nr:carbonic anhydrase [Acidimicrobiia bacterium]
MGEFATVLNCMDGRVQRQVADYLANSFEARYIDTITTAGTVRHLATDTDQTITLLANLAVSLDKHGSSQIAVVAHHDCAGNPIADNAQIEQLGEAIGRIRDNYPELEVIALWVDTNWAIERVG